MKISTRVKLIVISALIAAVLVAGSAWAAQTTDAVKQIIDDFGLSATVSGSTITVVNSADNPLVKDINSANKGNAGFYIDYYLLNLGDITGLTIDWKANLTIIGDQNFDDDEYVNVVRFEKGTFNMTAGSVDIQATGSFVLAIEGQGVGSIINIRGGTVRGLGARHFGVAADSNGDKTGKVTVTGGEILFTNHVAIAADFFEASGGTIDGLVIILTQDEVIEIHGDTNTADPIDFDDKPDSMRYLVKNNSKWVVTPEILNRTSEQFTILIEKGAEMTLSCDTSIDISGTLTNYGVFILSGDTSIDISGTLTNHGEFINGTTINNYSSNTIDNQGTLTNNGTINNKSTGKITNTGTIYNTNGTINNEGVLQSNQTAKEMGGSVTGKEVEPISYSSGSSGCDAGFGIFALVALSLPLLRGKSRRK